MFEQLIAVNGELSAVVTRASGEIEDLGIVSGRRAIANPTIVQPKPWYERLWRKLKREGKIPAAMGLTAFIANEISKHLTHDHSGFGTSPLLMGLVTTAGANYIATDFASGQSTPHISGLNYHDCGTGAAVAGTVSVTGATNATPIVITATAHGRTTNDLVTIASVGGNTNANGNWQVTVLTANTLSLVGSTGNSAYTSGGTIQFINGAADTVLQTAAGTARVAGTQSNPSANIYKSVATISYTSSLNISEWGIFSASSSGTLLDRRVFNNMAAPATTATGAITLTSISVNNGDSIAFTYQLTVSAGGS